MTTAEEHRHIAEEFFRMAREAKTEEERKRFFDMALSWSQVSVIRDFETGGGLKQERVWRIMVDVTRLVCGEATDGFGWSCV